MRILDGTTGRPLRRAAIGLAGAGIALVGMAIGVSVRPAAELVSATPGGPVTSDQALLIVAAAVLFGVAAAVGQRARGAAADDLLGDPVSGLYRRSYVDEVVSNLAARDDRAGRSQLALAIIGFAYLDTVERRHGRAAVDRLLDVAGRAVRGQTREGDLPMRDGDRFLVYLQCDDVEQGNAFCRRLVMLLGREQFDVDGDVVKLSLQPRVALRACGEPVAAFLARAAALPPGAG